MLSIMWLLSLNRFNHEDFEASKKFIGARSGFVFKRGKRGCETQMVGSMPFALELSQNTF